VEDANLCGGIQLIETFQCDPSFAVYSIPLGDFLAKIWGVDTALLLWSLLGGGWKLPQTAGIGEDALSCWLF
jgi:hypothetical protein